MLGLLRAPLLFCIVHLIDVFVSLYQIHGQLPQRGRRGVPIGGRFGRRHSGRRLAAQQRPLHRCAQRQQLSYSGRVLLLQFLQVLTNAGMAGGRSTTTTFVERYHRREHVGLAQAGQQ